jgi:hypothetical protein
MSRYFFHLRRDGETVSDIEGDEFRDDAAARASAINSVREIAAAQIKSGQVVTDAFMDVADETGNLLFSISFHDVVQNHLKK